MFISCTVKCLVLHLNYQKKEMVESPLLNRLCFRFHRFKSQINLTEQMFGLVTFTCLLCIGYLIEYF